MGLGAVALIRNEADILPVWLDALAGWANVVVLMDHGSDDGSRELMAAACAGRPSWVLMDIDEPAYWQERFTAIGAEHAFNAGADWVLPVDADEFPRVRGAVDMRGRLDICRGATMPAFRWVNKPLPNAILATSYLGAISKVALSRDAFSGGVRWDFGNYRVRNRQGFALPSRDVGEIWHFPMRSVAQIARKRAQAAEAIMRRGDRQARFVAARAAGSGVQCP